MAFKLPRIPGNIALVDPSSGRVTTEFQRWWQTTMEAIEGQESNQQALIDALATTVSAVTAAQASADAAAAAAAAADAAAATAATAAAAAQTSADSVTSDTNISNSYVIGVAIAGHDAGASATVNISAHSRLYGDGATVAVNSGSVTTLAYSTSYYIYYDDPSRAGGAVTYHVTTSIGSAAQSGVNPNRHYVGAVVTPAALAADTAGVGAAPPAIIFPLGFSY